MNTTSTSTAADDAKLRLLLPSALANRVLAYEDELEARRAAAPDAEHARQVRTERLDALVEHAASGIRANLEEKPQCRRITKVLDQLKIKADIYGLPRFANGAVKLPTRAVVKRVLIKMGLYDDDCDHN